MKMKININIHTVKKLIRKSLNIDYSMMLKFIFLKKQCYIIYILIIKFYFIEN